MNSKKSLSFPHRPQIRKVSICRTHLQQHEAIKNAIVEKTMLVNKRTLRFRLKFDNEPRFGAESVITNDNGTISILNVRNGTEAEFCLHELVELTIFDTIEKVYRKAPYIKAVENVAHFLCSESLNQRYFNLKTTNGITSYVRCDNLPSFEAEIIPEQRDGVPFGKDQKSGEKSGKEIQNMEELVNED